MNAERMKMLVDLEAAVVAHIRANGSDALDGLDRHLRLAVFRFATAKWGSWSMAIDAVRRRSGPCPVCQDGACETKSSHCGK